MGTCGIAGQSQIVMAPPPNSWASRGKLWPRSSLTRTCLVPGVFCVFGFSLHTTVKIVELRTALGACGGENLDLMQQWWVGQVLCLTYVVGCFLVITVISH